MKLPEGAPQLKRKLRGWEQQWPWIIVAVLASGSLFGLAYAVAEGFFQEIDPFLFGANLRGYTAFGLTMGVLAVVLAILTFFYSYRKRSVSQTLPLRGTVMMWLSAHIYLGFLGLLASALHAGFGVLWADGARLSSGKVLFYIFALLMISGTLWRLVYLLVPRLFQERILNYSQKDTAARIQQRLVEIEKVAAGKSAAFHEFKELAISLSSGRSSGKPTVENLLPEERAAAEKLTELAVSLQRARQRARLQARADALLQNWRWMHVPLAFAFFIVLAIHIMAVSDLPARAFPAQAAGYRPSIECRECHEQIYDQWVNSMHAHALDSPVTVVQTNQVVTVNLKDENSPDPLLVCQNCHAPTNTAMTLQPLLPFEPPPGVDYASINEGVNCASCHQFAGQPSNSGGAFAAVFQAQLRPGRLYFGPYSDPVGNAYHQSKPTDMWAEPHTLCQSCHNVQVDRNGDGIIQKGVDLVLQTTYDEFERYLQAGGTETCVTCHMPLVSSNGRIAEAASIPHQQDRDAPPRLVREHSFVGVDYPLDLVSESDPQRTDRLELLREAARMELVDESVQIVEADNGSRTLNFTVSITNNDLGHNLPTGFAFARQMWLEIIVVDANGQVVYESGVLASNTADLCDAGTLDDPRNPMVEYVVGCSASDPQLTNIQQKLVDDVDILRNASGDAVVDANGEFVPIQAVGGSETWMQNLNGGAVARTRPVDGQVLGTIPSGETRFFGYEVLLEELPPGDLTISVRLLFRNLPPYFLRALVDNAIPEETVDLEPMIPNLQIVEMVRDSFKIQVEE